MTWKHFTLEEFRCKGHSCCNHDVRMAHDFIDLLDELRDRCGFPLIVSSGYRCSDHNQSVSNTGPSGPHVRGRAVDFAVSHEQAHTLLKHALDMGFTGIGINQKGLGRFIHLDTLISGPRPNVWSYP